MKQIIKNLARWSMGLPRRTTLNLYAISTLLVILALSASTALGAFQQPEPVTPETGIGGWNVQTVGTAGWTPETVDDMPTFRFMTDRSLAYRNDNMPCVVYGGDQLYYACWNPTVSKWQSEVVDSAPLTGAYAALAFNSNSRPFISYYDAANGNLKLAYNLAGVWVLKVVDTNPVALSSEDSTQEDDTTTSPELRAFYDKLQSIPWSNPLEATNPQMDIAEIVYDGGGVGKHTSIAVDHLGRVHISYYDDDNRDLKYALLDGISPIPVIEVVDLYLDQGRVGLWSSIAVDANGVPQIAYMSEKYDDLKFAWRKGNPINDVWDKWTVDSASNVGSFASLAVDANGLPLISYMDFANYNLKFARMDLARDWHVASVDTNDSVGWYSSIARDAAGKVHISYYNMTSGNLKYAKLSGGTWSVGTIYSKGDLGYFTSIAIDKTELPGIVFGNATENALQYTHLTGGDWIASTITYGKTADVGMATSLALTRFSEPYISYLDDSADFLKLAHYFSWTDSWYKDFVRTDINAGAYSSVALLNGTTPWIAFYDQTNRDLILAKWVGDKWVYESVDTVGDVGKYVSLAIDSAGYPHMSYYDATNSELRYATWNLTASDWITTQVDYAGDVGLFTSMVLNYNAGLGKDVPYISYYDASKEMIKYAFKTDFDAWVNFPLDEVGDWLDTTIVQEAYSSIAVDGTGKMRIAYYCDYYCQYDLPSWTDDDSEPDQDLKFAAAKTIAPVAPGDWDFTSLDTAGDVGKYVSLAIKKGTDERHLSFYDATNADLLYRFSNGAWVLPLAAPEIVDSGGDVGRFSSLELNADGLPAISYYDAFLGNLKYAATFAVVPSLYLYLPLVLKE